MRSALTLAVLLVTARFAAASEAYAEDAGLVVSDTEVEVEIDAISSAHEALPHPTPEPLTATPPRRVQRHRGRLVLGWGDDACFELRMIRGYDGREVLTMTFAHDGRCDELPEEGKPAATP